MRNVLLLGLALVLSGLSSTACDRTSASEERADSGAIQVHDGNGRVRIELSVDDDGTAFLRMLDGKGEERCKLSVREGGESSVALKDNGRPLLMLDMTPRIKAQVLIANSRGSPRVMLRASLPDMSYGLFLEDEKGGIAGGLTVSRGDGGWPALVLAGRGGREDFVATAANEDGGALTIKSDDGRILFKVGSPD